MVGFKSFADKTRIELDKGFTAIIGPNGSGKSNIIEAIKWVLGEQSAKSLRGNEWMMLCLPVLPKGVNLSMRKFL